MSGAIEGHMHITELRMRNFRNFHRARLPFRKGVNTLIGENASGKSNALHAIRLLIDDSLSRRATRLLEEDFCRILPDWRGHWIVISLDFDDLDLSEGCQIIRHGVGLPASPGAGRLTLYFRPTFEARKRLFEARPAGREAVEAVRNALTLENYEACFTGRASADFLDDDVYKSLVGDIAAGVFPNPSDDDAHELGVIMHGLYDEVSCTFIRALRDVVSDMRNSRTNPLLTLLRGGEKRIALGDSARIGELVRGLNTSIGDLAEVRGVSGGVQATMLSAIGRTYSPVVSIASELPEEMDRLMQHLALRVGDDAGHQAAIGEIGLGGANLIFIALKLLEYEAKLSNERAAHFLLIEEPEAHLHPHVQRTLFMRYEARRTQVIVTSHSAHLSSVASIRSINVLARRARNAVVFVPAQGLSEDECARVERFLDAERSTLLFAKGVLLVEGDAERLLIPTIVRQALGVGLDDLGVSLVPVGGAVFRNLAPLFHPERIQRPCAIITDLDTPLCPLPADPKLDTDADSRARMAAKIGASRRLEIGQFETGNPWARGFFADSTFEVEFMRAGNRDIVVSAVESAFTQRNAFERSRALLEGGDSGAAGRELLRIAEYCGKGWFALQLAARVAPGVGLPVYILAALAFASRESTNAAVVREMAEHRAKRGLCHPVPADAAREMRDDEYIAAYMRENAGDLLTAFVRLQRA